MRLKIALLLYCFIALLAIFGGFGGFGEIEVRAQRKEVSREEEVPSVSRELEEMGEEATAAAEIEAIEATFSASPIVEKVVEKKPDITEPKPEIKDKLERYLTENPLKSLTITNFLQHAIRKAVKRGVPANTIVLILLFPVVVALVAFTRHFIGIEGFDIFTPAVIAVASLATGISAALILFLTILLVATISRIFMRKIRLQYLPQMALLLCFVCLGVFVLLLISSYLNLENLITVSIFPILIMTLLAQEFIDLQNRAGMRIAISRIGATLLIACVGFWLMNAEVFQKFVLLNPETTIVGVVVFDYFLGRFAGLRLWEYKRFRELLKS